MFRLVRWKGLSRELRVSYIDDDVEAEENLRQARHQEDLVARAHTENSERRTGRLSFLKTVCRHARREETVEISTEDHVRVVFSHQSSHRVRLWSSRP